MIVTTRTVTSPLGSWTHSEWRPPALRGVVDHMWHFAGRMTMPRERTFPGGYLELILHLGPRFHDVDASGARADAFPVACLTGMLTRPQLIESPAGECRVLGVRLHPLGAYALLGRPLHESTDLTLDVADLAGRAASELAERCHDARTVEARFSIVAAWIAGRLERGRPERAPEAHGAMARTVAQLRASHGSASIAALRDQVGMGGARFVKVFSEQVGLTPKRYARVLRFRHALLLLQRGGRLSDVALGAGYYDQPHMNADFREFAGMTPAEFVRAIRYPHSPSVPEAAEGGALR